jgi:hypothetical protein
MTGEDTTRKDACRAMREAVETMLQAMEALADKVSAIRDAKDAMAKTSKKMKFNGDSSGTFF